MKWALTTNRKGLDVFQAQLPASSGKYCMGDQVTMADAFLIPQLYNADRFGIDLKTEYPKLAAIRENLNQLPAFDKAHANNQPDAQK